MQLQFSKGTVRFFKYGAPMMILMLAGSFGLSEFTDLRVKKREETARMLTAEEAKQFLKTKESESIESLLDGKKQYNKPDQARANETRDATNFVLGFDHARYLTTNRDYKPHQDAKKPSRRKGGEKTRIADFCPDYQERSKGKVNTEYQIMYKTLDKDARSIPKTLKERRKYTNDLKETHFKLGNSSNSITSETQHSFCKNANVLSDDKQSNALETYKSRIFRPGDWNSLNRDLLNTGVTQRDFNSPLKEIYELNNDLKAEKTYHRATHFSLGCKSSKDASVYQKDFALSRKIEAKRGKFMNPVGPPLAHLFSDNSPQHFVTTQKKNYTDRDRKLVMSIRRERQVNLEEVKKRHAENSVPLSLNSHCDSHRNPLSITSSDYYEQLRLPKSITDQNVVKHYNHFSGECDELSVSEAKDRFIVHDEHISKTLRDECRMRRRDNKSTHFAFGTDKFDEKRTEQSSQYREHLPVDPTLRAAGKGLLQRKTYSHVYPCLHSKVKSLVCSSMDTSCYSQNISAESVMKQDYKRKDVLTDGSPHHTDCHLQHNRSVDTHFFHLDNHYSANSKSSTTKTDFMAPSAPI